MKNLEKSRNIHHFFDLSLMPENLSWLLEDTPERILQVLEASEKLPEHFRENSKFHENLDFFGSPKKLSCARYFATAHTPTQRRHSWIAGDLR